MGWRPFYSVFGKLAVGLSYQIGQTGPPYWSDRLDDSNWLRALSKGKYLISVFGLGLGLVR
jgi:hypothetical protein